MLNLKLKLPHQRFYFDSQIPTPLFQHPLHIHTSLRSQIAIKPNRLRILIVTSYKKYQNLIE